MSEPRRPGNPFEWLFRISVLVLGASIALNLATMLLDRLVPWLIGTFVGAAAVWIVVAFVRWRRSRW